MAVATRSRGYVDPPRPSGLADVVEVIPDKSLVHRCFRAGLADRDQDPDHRCAHRDRQRRHLPAVRRGRQRLDIVHDSDSEGLPQLIESMTEGGAKSSG